MNRDRTLIGGIVLLGIGIVIIGAIWYFVLRTPAEASAPIESVPLELTEAATAVPDPPTAAPTEAPTTDDPVEETPTEAVPITEESADEETASEETPTEGASIEETTNEDTDPEADLILYEISPDGSEVRFILNEELRGQPTTVIGVTNQVAGQVAANNNDLATVQLGVILINARTFVTDNNFRNNAIQNRILNTNEFEFIEFAPTAVNGLPESVELGESVTFEVVGDLTIRDVTNEVTFAVTAAATTPDQLAGSAVAEVLRSDFALQIPSVPNVANVTDDVQLEIDFIANAVEQ